MFFKNIEKYHKSTLIALTLVFELIYLVFMLVAPMATIMAKYHVFTKKPSSINGYALFLILIFGIIALRYVRKMINKLPQATRGEQFTKFNLQLLFALIIPVACIVILYLFKSDFKLAYSCFKMCAIWFLIGIIVDYTNIKYLEAEWSIRNGATIRSEENKRINNGVIK